MNKKGQGINVGLIIITLVTVIVGLVLLTGVSPFIGQTTDTQTFTGQVIPIGSRSIDLTGQELISLTSLVNASGTSNCINNYTVAEGVSPRTGTKRILLSNASTTVGCANGVDGYVNISYVYGAEGYIDDSGGRAVTEIILVFMALAIAVVAIVPALRSGVIELMSK